MFVFCLSLLLIVPISTTRLSCTISNSCSVVKSNSVLESSRIVAIGDIHGSYEGLLEDLFDANITTSSSSCAWKVQSVFTLLVQSGDYVDRGPGALEAFTCLQSLQEMASENNGKVVRIFGNHEMWWLEDFLHYKNKLDSRKKIRQVVETVKTDILSGQIVGAYLTIMNGVPIIFNHAGFSSKFLKHLRQNKVLDNDWTPQELVNITNQDLVNVVRSCPKSKCQFHGLLYEASPERGGRGIGGPYWSDFSVLEEESTLNPFGNSFIQVVGHTMADCYRRYHSPSSFQQCPEGLIRSTIDLSAIAVDGGMYLGGRGFLEIGTDGHFRAYEKLGKEKRMVDFTKNICSSYCNEQKKDL